MIEIRQLTGVTLDTIHQAWIQAFADYVEPISLSMSELQYMIERRGCQLDLSFGAFDNDRLVGFTLNGIGKWNGEETAYDTGTGMIKAYREKGIAARMFNESLPILKANGISQYLLEVIKTNESAFQLYRKSGFQITREFDYFIAKKEDVSITLKDGSHRFMVKDIHQPDWDLFQTLWDFAPSWQNSIDAINRKRAHFNLLGVFEQDALVGYGLIEQKTGDIPQLCIDKRYRRKGLATVLVQHLLQRSSSTAVKIINTPAGNTSFRKFAGSIHLAPGFGQYEMILKLISHVPSPQDSE